MNSRSGIAPEGETVRSVENEVCSDQLLRARFGFMAELFELSKYNLLNLPFLTNFFTYVGVDTVLKSFLSFLVGYFSLKKKKIRL